MASKREIWKFVLHNAGDTRIRMPEGAAVLSIQNQRDDVTLWALVDPMAPLIDRTFYTALTGERIDMKGRKYLDTVQLAEGSFVAHVFEVLG